MQLNMRDWHLPALAVGAFIFARMTGGKLPYYSFYLSAGILLSAWIWTRYALRRTECTVLVERARIEVGESLAVRVRLDNDTLLPLPWAEVDDATPQHLVSTDMPCQATSVPLLGSRIINFKLVARRRGHYTVGPIQVRLGDPFGLFAGKREFQSRSSVTIYPRVHRIDGLGIPLSQPFGPVRTREKAFEDPSNQAEIREYRPGDNPRHIHWKASARRGELMLREYELNATTPMVVFPDLSMAAQAGDPSLGETSTEETVVETAASLAALGLRRNIDVGMICHGQERFAVTNGRGERTFHEILEVLARAEARGRLPMERVLELESARLTGKSTVVVITPQLTAALADTLVRMRARHQLMVVLLRRETYSTRAAAEIAAAAEQGGEPVSPVPPFASLLVTRKIPVYLVCAGDDLRRLADLRLSAAAEGVRSWSSNGRPQPTRR